MNPYWELCFVGQILSIHAGFLLVQQIIANLMVACTNYRTSTETDEGLKA